MNDDDIRAALLRIAVGRTGPVVPDRAAWDQWTFVAQLERVAPLLYQLIDTVPTELSHDQRQDVAQIQGASMSRCVQLEHHLIAMTSLFAEHGLRSAVLKGGATAHLDYPDPSWREVSDVDLLIDPANLTKATALLGSAGWTQGYALPKGHESFTHAMTFVRDGMELDLHQRIGHRALGLLVPTAELLERAVRFEIAGSAVFALDEVDRLIHAALHAVTSRGPSRRLSGVADVLLAADSRSHDADEVLSRAEGWRVRPLVERGIHDAYVAAQLEVDDRWLRKMARPTRLRDRLVEHAYLSPGRHPPTEELAYLRLMDDWLQRWRYVRGYLATDDDYAAQHGRRGLGAQVRYLAGKLRSHS